jgi:hypothetical protein
MSDNFEANLEKRRRDLWFAMRTRPLTDAEMEEAEGWGKYLSIVPRQSYSIHDDTPARALADAWALQGTLRATARQANTDYIGGANNSLFEIGALGT